MRPHGRRSDARGAFQRERLRSEHGSGLIELALAMPVFLLILFGFVNFTLIIFGVCNMTYAARAATRYICMHSTKSYGYIDDSTVATNAGNIVNQYLFKYPQNTSSTNISYQRNTTNSSGFVLSTVVVTIRVTYNISLPGYTYNGLALNTLSAGVIVQ